jgi:hypothetical protein
MILFGKRLTFIRMHLAESLLAHSDRDWQDMWIAR